LDLFFTAIFTAELIFNILAHWFLPFVTSAWSLIPTGIYTLANFRFSFLVQGAMLSVMDSDNSRPPFTLPNLPIPFHLSRHMFDFVIVLLALVALGPINIPVKALRVRHHAIEGWVRRATDGEAGSPPELL
jgi:hypothetical protein